MVLKWDTESFHVIGGQRVFVTVQQDRHTQEVFME